MAEKLIIIGAGDHGRGTLEIVKARNARAAELEFDVIGFLDDDPGSIGRTVDGWPVLGPVSWVAGHHHETFCYVLGIANGGSKKTLAQKLEPFNPRYATLVHPTAVLGTGVQLGEGCIIAAGAVVAYETRIGRHVTVNLNATVGHDCALGDYCTVAPGANIAGKVSVREACDLGLNCTVVRSVNIHERSTICPGSVVLRDIPAGTQVFGNPARVIGATPVATHPSTH